MHPDSLTDCPDCDGAGQWMQGPKYRRCELCEGRGKVCAECNGRGERQVSFGEAGVIDAECEPCDGVGRDDSLPDLYAAVPVKRSGYCHRCDVYPVDMLAHVCRGMPANLEHWYTEPKEDGT